jgi:hypothetical protein
MSTQGIDRESDGGTDFSATPSGSSRVDDQAGGYGFEPDEDEGDFADEHSQPTFADEQAGRPGMEPDEDTPSGIGGMDADDRG